MTTQDPKEDDYIDSLLKENRDLYDKVGLTKEYLAKKHKRELNAKETKTIKVKGAIDGSKLPPNYRLISTSGTLIYDDEGNAIGGDGESVIEYSSIAWGPRQKGRHDASVMRGEIPIVKQEITGNIQVTPKLSPEEWDLIREKSEKVVDAILSNHIRNITDDE